MPVASWMRRGMRHPIASRCTWLRVQLPHRARGGAAVRQLPPHQAPQCPPDCGSVAAGDPLLVPVHHRQPRCRLACSSVRRRAALCRHPEAQPEHETVRSRGQCRRRSMGVGHRQLRTADRARSSGSLVGLHLASPARNAGISVPRHVASPAANSCPSGDPGSVSGLCALLPPRSSAQGRDRHRLQSGQRGHPDRDHLEVEGRPSTSADSHTWSPSGSTGRSRPEASSSRTDSISTWSSSGSSSWRPWSIGVVACRPQEAQLARHPSMRWSRHSSPQDRARRLARSPSSAPWRSPWSTSSLLHGSGQWFESSYNDFWRNWADSAYLTFSGGYGHLYVLDRTLETAPAIQVLMAPIARLAFGLSFPDPNTVLYPQAYWVAGPLLLALMAFPSAPATDGSSTWASRMDVGDSPSWARWRITLPPIVLYGHAEDLVALGAMLYGLVAAQEAAQSCGRLVDRGRRSPSSSSPCSPSPSRSCSSNVGLGSAAIVPDGPRSRSPSSSSR